MAKRLNAHLSTKQIHEFESFLQDELEKITEISNQNSDEYIVKNEENSDEVDQASAQQDRDQLIRFRNRNVFYVKKLQKSLDKIAKNEFGICEDCGAEIKFERLKARPTAELCILCKEESEKDESQNFIKRQSKSLGQTLHLQQTL